MINKVAGHKTFMALAMLAMLFLLGACGGNDNVPVPTQPFPPTTFPGNNPNLGNCGTIPVFPIGRTQVSSYYSNLSLNQQYITAGGFPSGTMNTVVGYVDATTNNIAGSATLNVDVASLLGYQSIQPSFCVSSFDSQSGATFYGTGYGYGNAFILEQVTMKGFTHLPGYQGSIPTPVTVILGASCQTYVDLSQNRIIGCVDIYVEDSFYGPVQLFHYAN